ncbi:MAG: hypothetical protein IT292_02175 [Deltaproteobacteria bacterium]|nr:hypothetical protein [Deltaproteobacteria bacterium]
MSLMKVIALTSSKCRMSEYLPEVGQKFVKRGSDPRPVINSGDGRKSISPDWIFRLAERINGYERPIALNCEPADLALILDTPGGMTVAKICLLSSYRNSNHYLKLEKSVSQRIWHEKANGANLAKTHTIAQIAEIVEQYPDLIQRDDAAIVPIGDLLYFALTGVRCHCSDLLQRAGLLKQSDPAFMDRLLNIDELHKKVAPWKHSRMTDAYCDSENEWIVPPIYGPSAARDVGFDSAPCVVYTGRGCGVAHQLCCSVIRPSETTYSAGFTFEGNALQKLSVACGEVYKRLLAIWEISYEEAGRIGGKVNKACLPVLDVQGLNRHQGTDSLPLINKALQESHCSEDPLHVIAAVVNTAVEAVWADLQVVTRLIGKPLRKVAVVGPWAENELFLRWLEDKGIEIAIPRLAVDAKLAGVVAHAKQAILAQQTECPPTFGEVLTTI